MAQKPSDFKHTTLTTYPDKIAGLTIVDEKPGFTGIYLRSSEGGLYPVRTVCREEGRIHDGVVDAWLSREGVHVDQRKGKY